MKKNRKLILEDGSVYEGYGFGDDSERVLELVFNTSMVGYQEIISDPSYTDQAVVMTYPLIGNYGINEEDYESQTPTIGGLVVREYNDDPSNFRCSHTLNEVMIKYEIVGICGVDTRQITRKLRDKGSMKAMITDIEVNNDEALGILNMVELSHNAVSRVTSKSIWKADMVSPIPRPSLLAERKLHVVAIDCGMKQNILRSLLGKGLKVTVVPYDTDVETIEALKPDGIFISNGPGDPEDAVPVIEAIRELKGRYPIFGICLGHQILSLAYGARTYKLKFGHRGGNHPVKNLNTGKIEITSQNHSYAVDADSIASTSLEVTHINLLDNTIEGVCCTRDRAFGVQYHPESCPGPQDSDYLFGQFIDNMKRGCVNNA
ncbi:glutamine-hydrolyzing carbamoyl-phosphate synthase small subunit [Lacrimispora saccharolytica]|uniref:glutamine-hydrolyzing carbamoyl-phosphate synthase small subunit n=1 Tax=Lacrimispora saccharolytica TaxID=84030 RepID=UPI001B72C207|nr:glutamine-hydrolyzing carbamoyl-phosphate synthase small subunit [Lacrimispora saccharolytica]MBP9001152.1 glutamine-hydrolyzing carbamoyl-phosphate synthase small subunit [Lachnospiraceae bacterium]MBS7329871.1 glutamine-hydrolyzing carbamoyl-phosphate synthase small subunit [Lachnospiraceae bacterium]MCF2655911.1 glutamine-hydrolyzing carbamoyl-phosphate synthase small subunit [Lacrimispora saccharolytica]MDY4126244.1 glutamine-hydrolyzing carbamoyl-phosphate synthase small subunit [Lachno